MKETPPLKYTSIWTQDYGASTYTPTSSRIKKLKLIMCTNYVKMEH